MKPPRSSKSAPYFTAMPQTFASGSRKLKPYPQPDRSGSGSRSATSSNPRSSSWARTTASSSSQWIVSVEPLEPRLGEQPEHDPVRALKDDVFGHARRRFRPAELPVERSHAPDVPAGERDGADPCWNAHRNQRIAGLDVPFRGDRDDSERRHEAPRRDRIAARCHHGDAAPDALAFR
jgi:hypothetical protein